MNSETVMQEASIEQQIGYHRGALTTLVKERAEMVRIVLLIDKLLRMHASELRRLGVTIEAEQAEELPAKRQIVTAG